MNVALVGTGNLGRALCNYNMYIKDNMKIVAVFDADMSKAGTSINHLQVQPMQELTETVRKLDIAVGIITVPAGEAQNVADRFVSAGIRGLLNFAPVVLKAAPACGFITPILPPSCSAWLTTWMIKTRKTRKGMWSNDEAVDQARNIRND